MRIAFVSGNREKLPDAVIPLGLLYVMASTSDRHDKTLVDLCFERHPAEALRRRLAELEPDLIALGMRNIQNADYSGVDDHLDYYAELVAASRGATSAPIVLGGGGFSVMPRELMERLRPDYGISGEGEHAFSQLVDVLEGASGRLSEIAGLHRFENGKLVSNPPDPGFLDTDRLPPPARSFVDRRYYERYGIDSVQTKRGCPLRCDYCTYPLIEGRVARTRDPVAVVDEMFRLVDEHPEVCHIFVVDSVFNLPQAHAKAVCRELTARDWRLPWTCYANPLGFDRELVQLAKAAGCAGMEIGSDSGCDEVLRSLRKGFTLEHIRRLHALCRDADIPDCHTFILGTRGETLEQVCRTLDFIEDLDPFSAILLAWVDDREALSPQLRKERLVLRERIHEILDQRKDQFSHWIIPPLGVRFDQNLFRRLRRGGLRGPLWQHIRGPRGAQVRSPRSSGSARE